ncbi:MAG: DUF5107 domain-containing protein [Acetatifactor sp.]|nr:DUF5107 domain-containing protein [Acetatifactor sp.]
MNHISKVSVWEETITIPTYEAGRPDKNPLFLAKRVYQGSSGKVYPHSVTDKISDVKTDREYRAVYLENDYLRIMILPELGGRVQRAYDKTRNYDFVYYNHVIKPALVGLAGPWISGGIEFNWPQHHRPSTFDEVNYTYRENPDGSATVIVSEIENMFHTRGETEFTLYPDKAYLELKNHLFNRTGTKQTFLWWANPAVAVNENYRSIFPPDVTAVMDHGKRDVSAFPIATGTYYKVDYSAGVDISKYKNLPVPTSYMAAKSDYDFVGGFDDGIGAGILHVADHHISPGKKQWTWGCGDFGKAWDRNLTDEDGPYIELMTGCFTDNQPDFSYIAPMESKDFIQYFMPYHDLGTVHNATKDLALNLSVDSKITVRLYCSGTLGSCEVRINDIYSRQLDLLCSNTCEVSIDNSGYRFEDIVVRVVKDGRTILFFDGNVKKQEIPEAAEAAPLPENCKTTEDLYLYGLHIEQYRHATRRAEDYYLEGLRRDNTDIRLNNAYGMLLFKKGCILESEQYFRAALAKQTRSNPNPATGEVYYNLGLCLFYQGRYNESFDAFYKAVWNADTKGSSCFYLSLICSRRGDYENALDLVDQALIYNSRNFSALNLRTMLLKVMDMDYTENAEHTLRLDNLDICAMYLLGQDISGHIINPNMAIDLSLEFAMAGFYDDADALLSMVKDEHPMIDYYRAYYSCQAGREYVYHLDKAFLDSPYCCFPNRLEDIAVLEFAIRNNPKDFKAPYYLGNLYYDRERYGDAAECFEKSIETGCDFATPFRNLSLLCYNVKGDPGRALELLSKAYSIDESDARVLYELDLLKKRMGISPVERLDFLEKHPDMVTQRDDLYLEYITLLNLTGKYDLALQLIMSHKFHPWEGGEGKVPEQYLFSNIALGIRKDDLNYLLSTFTYPHNLGEGKLYGAQENRQNYYLGCAYEKQGKSDLARECFRKASEGISEPASAMYYNDQPPETIFYQGMAHLRLDNRDGAENRFHRLIDYADAHIEDDVMIDYFAVSLPDLLVFEEDINRKNRLHCLFMKALGLYGLGRKEESRSLFQQALQENCNTFQIATHYQLLFEEG